MPSRTTPTLLAALLLCALVGCSQWRYDLGMPLDAVTLPAQHTPLAQVLQQLGPPLRLSATDSGYVMAWEHWTIREDAIGVRLGALGADFLSADWGQMRVAGDFLLLTFNRQHLLTSATSSHWDNYGGGGQAIQPFYGFISVVDSDDLTRPMPQHRWGGSMLQHRLSATLNRQSDPDTGQNGLQRRGTPSAAGQRALQSD